VLDNGFLIQRGEEALLSVLEWILCVAKRAGLAVLWERRNEGIVLLISIRNDEERERLEEAIQELLPMLKKKAFRKFSEGKYEENNFPSVPDGATMLCVDENNNIIFLQ
jgi:hypothetical protein